MYFIQYTMHSFCNKRIVSYNICITFKYMKNLLHKYNLHKYKKIIIVLLVMVIIAAVAYYNTNDHIIARKAGHGLDIISDEAAAYKKINNNYGIIASLGRNYNCFSGNTFIKSKKIEEMITTQGITDMSCRFKVNDTTKTLNDWSVSLQMDQKVYCIDSKGNDNETPGFTLTASCKGE